MVSVKMQGSACKPVTDKGLGVAVSYKGNLNIADLLYFLVVVLAVCYVYQIYIMVHQKNFFKKKPTINRISFGYGAYL